MLRVVKVGGRPLEDMDWVERFAGRLASAAGRTVVVHGGGPEVDAVSARLGIPVERIEGRRVTSPAALDAAAMVLTGRVNKRLVSVLLDADVDAVGLSGEDGALLVAEPEDEPRLGRVGTAPRVRTELLDRLLALGVVPVLSPICRGTDGRPLNVNADEAAAAVAVALGADELLFVTDVAGVHDGGALRPTLGPAEARALVAAGRAREGMAVKLAAAVRAAVGGVPVVRIGPGAVLAEPGAGTRITTEVAA